MPTSQRTHDTAASFVLKTARVAYSLTDARAAHSGPVETFRLRAPETGLHGPKDEARFRKIVRESGTHPECCFIPGTPSRTKHASTSVAQVPSQASPLPRRVHATVGTLLDRARKGQLVAIRIRHVEIPLAHLDGSFCGTAECSFNRNLWLRCHSPLPMVVYTVPF